MNSAAEQHLSRYARLKARANLILSPAVAGDRASLIFDYVLLGTIVLNVIAVILETVNFLETRYGWFFAVFERASVAFFSLEYVLRIWSCTAQPRYTHPFSGRLRFALSPLILIDLLAVLPAYVGATVLDLRFLRIMRAMRVFRVLKIARYYQALRVVVRVFVEKKEQLVVSLSMLLMILVVCSCLMFFLEHAAQPDKYSSIPAAMWWAVSALTTVGYGDITPVTPLGKFVSAVISVLGIGLFAVPAGILASGFQDVLQRQHRVCPRCGANLAEHAPEAKTLSQSEDQV